MNEHTSSYPDFVSTVLNNREHFVFGAGASKSFSSEAMGWFEWLKSGASRLEDRDELKVAINGEPVGDVCA